MTKKQAIEILTATTPDREWLSPERIGAEKLLEALDRAGAFPSEESAAEPTPQEWEGLEAVIRNCAFEGDCENARAALRKLSACRAAGLVKR